MINEKMYELGESRSVIRDISEFGNARKAEIGAENVYDFSIGNPSVPTPERIRKTLEKLLRETDPIELHSYTPAPGMMSARQAVAKQESLRAGHEIPADSFYMTCGSSSSLAISLRAIVCGGERVAVLAPYFPEYKVFIENAGAEIVVIPPADESMQPDMAAFEEEAKRGLKAVIVNSPNNPSGALLSEKTLSQMGEILKKYASCGDGDTFMISDEPYRELVYDNAQVPFVPNIYPDTIVCYSYSKSLSLPGERIGYIMVPPCVKNSRAVFSAVCGAGRSLGHICAPSLYQYLLTYCADEIPQTGSYDKNRRLLYGMLTDMGFECVRPDGAFYMFMKVPGGNAIEFCKKAMEYEILFVPSDSFGLEGYVRVAYCVSEEMIRKSEPALKKLAAEYGLL